MDIPRFIPQAGVRHAFNLERQLKFVWLVDTFKKIYRRVMAGDYPIGWPLGQVQRRGRKHYHPRLASKYWRVIIRFIMEPWVMNSMADLPQKGMSDVFRRILRFARSWVGYRTCRAL